MTLKHLKLDLTSKCNLKCSFCPYHWSKKCKKHNESKSVLDIEIIKTNIFSSSTNFESLQISWSWEGLLHPDFSEVVEFIRAKINNLRLITNWTLLKKHKNTIVNNFDNVLVSLHGSKEIHDEIVWVKGAYAKTIEWIIALKQQNFDKLKIHYVLTEKNIWDVKAMVEFATEYGIPIIFALDFLPQVKKYQSITQELIETLKYIRDNNFVINPNLNDTELVKFFTDENYIIDPYFCNHRYESIEISSKWNVYICRSNIFGNIYEQKLSKILRSQSRLHFLDEVKNEINSTTGLLNVRCNRCCYQKAPKYKQYD